MKRLLSPWLGSVLLFFVGVFALSSCGQKSVEESYDSTINETVPSSAENDALVEDFLVETASPVEFSESDAVTSSSEADVDTLSVSADETIDETATSAAVDTESTTGQ
ncbi:MAG: hypothetical protein LBU55_00010 [Elusimicrobiota bacterium]|jgi:hypothetical protein|nr:hypothetical protein [Elusimicrobiota bacterium]